MDLNGKVGFILQQKWYPNNGEGHEKNAFHIIEKMGWKEDWLNSHENPQDFIVLEKRAIQLGSGRDCKKIIVRSDFTESKVDRFKKKYRLDESYTIVFIG